jgi:hypothetical protein
MLMRKRRFKQLRTNAHVTSLSTAVVRAHNNTSLRPPHLQHRLPSGFFQYVFKLKYCTHSCFPIPLIYPEALASHIDLTLKSFHTVNCTAKVIYLRTLPVIIASMVDERKRVWSTNCIKATGENGIYQRKPCPTATSSTTLLS